MKLANRILLALVAGAVAGLLAGTLAPEAAWLRWIVDNVAEPAGKIFLRLLLMTVIPLVFASLALGAAGLGDLRQLGRMGGLTLLCFLLSTALSVLIGLVVAHLAEPGQSLDPATRDRLLDTYTTEVRGMREGAGELGVDTLVGIVPTNPVRAAADMQMLPLIFFSLVFGLALAHVPGERRAPMLDLLEATAAVVMKIITGVLWIAPVGVFALIFVATSRFGWELLEQLGLYVLVVVVGLLVHGGLVLSGVVAVLGRTSPLRFWKGARAAMITAFSTSSSNATLPTTMEVAERELGVPRPVARFVLPLGATLNMNGTALYEGVTVLFLAGVFGVSLSLGQQATVLLMCVLTAVGTAGVPGGSLPLLMGVLAAVGVPPEGIAVILGVDRILDMCRTLLNVSGDLAVAVVVGRVEQRP